MTGDDSKRGKYIACVVGIVPVVWAAVLAAPYHADGLLAMLSGFTEAVQHPFRLQWTIETPKTILLFLVIYVFALAAYFGTARNYRKKEEHGSASWGNAKDLNGRYADHKHPEQNRLLTQNCRMGLDMYKHQRNLNTLVCGGSGSSKTRGYAKPNIMQANASYIILDPKGEILRATGGFLQSRGYEIRILDLIHQERSHGYNPFRYLRDDADVMKLVTNLMKSTTPKGSNSNDPFWERAETVLLEALIFYLYHYAPEDEQNFAMVMEMIAAAEISEEDENFQSPLDILFERKDMDDPDSIAVKLYNEYRSGAGKTLKSVLISLSVRLEKFNLSTLAALTYYDEMDMQDIGEKKVALFAIIPDNDMSFNFIVGILYTQLFQQLFDAADYKHEGMLPVPVHFVMDEFCNVALPDDFDKILSVCRSRNVSCSIIIQNVSSLKALFDKQWESILGNCDTFLYLGGNEVSTHKYVSELLGKETIDTNTYGMTHGMRGNYTTNYQQTGRELLTPDEVRKLNNRYALLFIRGEPPVRDLKYSLMKHPNITLTADGGASPFRYGATNHANDWRNIPMHPDGEYEVLSSDELEEIFMKK